MTPYVERNTSQQYIEAIWHKTTDDAGYWVPADGCWDIIFAKRSGQLRTFVAGPMTRARLTRHAAGTELLGIRFRPGVYMPRLLPSVMLNRNVDLGCHSTRAPLWLEGVKYGIPAYETAELFVDKLSRNGVLIENIVVKRVLENQALSVSPRSVQRHFLQTTGLTRNFIEQVKRAQRAERLLANNATASRAAAQAGYADQAHMTRALKLLLGRTPSQLVHT